MLRDIDSPDEGDEVTLRVRESLSGLQGVELADQFRQAVAGDGGQHAALPIPGLCLLLLGPWLSHLHPRHVTVEVESSLRHEHYHQQQSN